jgi:hypothetical protein
LLGGFAAMRAAASIVTAVGSAVSAPASPRNGAREEARKERMELRDPVLGHVDDDLLVVRSGGWI